MIIISILVIILVFLIAGVGLLFLLKYNEKNKIRAVVFYADRTMKVFRVKPKNKTITFDDKTFNINDKNFVISKGLTTYVYNYNNTEPLDPFTTQITEYTPEEFNSAMQSKIVGEIVASSSGKNKMEMSTINLLIALATIGAVGIVAYLGSQMIGDLNAKLDLIIEGLKSIGIGGIE